jgi:hypothetical protein
MDKFLQLTITGLSTGMIYALIALGFNVLFIIVRSAGFWTSADLNQLSLVRIFLLTIVIAAVPFSTHEMPK